MRWPWRIRDKCRATLGTTFAITGHEPPGCELGRHGGNDHERWSPPLAARWTEAEGGRIVQWAESVEYGPSR